MPSALDTLHPVAAAKADVAMRPCLMLFARGPLRPHAAALDGFWQRLVATRGGGGFTTFRTGTATAWRNLADTDPALPFSARVGFDTAAPGGWTVEVAGAPGPDGASSDVHLQIEDRATVFGQVRASSVRVLFDATGSSADIASLGDWAIHHFPLWWGTGGWAFDHAARHPQFADARIAALAKRYWGVQLLDTAALQWDALSGMPSVNWLTLVGADFAAERGFPAEALADAAGLTADRLFVRQGPRGFAVAAGARPLPGDINVHEDFTPYVNAARRLAPLLLDVHSPLAGPLLNPDVLTAWLKRFADPQPWLDADLATE